MAKINPAAVASLLQRLNAVLNGREARQSLQLLQESGLSLPHVVSLYALDSRGAQSMSALAATLHLSLAATSQLVDRLVEAGLVARTESREDRRFKTVRLLPAGRRTLRSLHRTRTRELAEAVAKLPVKVQRELASALESALRFFEG